LGAFLISGAVSICTFQGWASLSPTSTTALFVVLYIFNAVFLAVYVILQIALVLNTLEDRWPLGDIAFGVFFVVVGQVALYAFSSKICSGVKHYLDGLFFATMCNLLGVMMVFGIVVSNAILLIDFVERNRADMPLNEALVLAGSVRVRPIMMTALATIVALVPVAAGLSTAGGGGLISQSLALVVEGGLVSSTFLTLLVIPIVYSWLRRRGRPAVQIADRLDAA